MKFNLRMLKVSLISLICFFTHLSATAQLSRIEKKLIGNWEFVELNDSQGNKLDTIWIRNPHSNPNLKMFRLPSGSIINFNPNGTFTRQFSFKKIEKGKWFFNTENNVITLRIYPTKTYGNIKNHVNYRRRSNKNSNQFVITYELVELNRRQLKLFEKDGFYRVYKKRKPLGS